MIKSPRECKSILIDPDALKFRLFVCHQTEEVLQGTSALKYIEWGKSQNFHKRPSCRGRARWWDLGEQSSFDFVILRFRDKRNWNPINGTPSLLAGDIMFVGSWRNRTDVDLNNALANSTFSILISEIYGRVNLGDGLLTTYGPEITRFDFIQPSIFDTLVRKSINDSFEVLKIREVKSIFDEVNQADRKQLDNIIFDTLNLTQGERDAIYEAVIELANNRLTKAESLKTSKEINRRLEAVENTLGIWMGIPEEEEEVNRTYV